MLDKLFVTAQIQRDKGAEFTLFDIFLFLCPFVPLKMQGMCHLRKLI
jgi:hypothetical protein